MSRVGAVYQASSLCRAKFLFVSHETGSEPGKRCRNSRQESNVFVSLLQNPAYGPEKL
jgi:hypothetical protein